MTKFGGKVCESSMNKNQARFYYAILNGTWKNSV